MVIVEKFKEREEVTQGPTDKEVKRKRKLAKSPSLSEKMETRASKKQETKQLFSSKRQTIKQRTRKFVDDTQDKKIEKKKEAKNEKEKHEIMHTPKPRVKQVAKKS